MSVAASIPPMTVVQMTRMATAPDPEAPQSGRQPRMNANDVMMIGRRRRRAPFSAASSDGRFAQLAASVRDDDDFSLDVIAHNPDFCLP